MTAPGGPVTTGAPISLMIENVDQRSKDYDDIRDLYRPGHADYVYDAKYGVRDYRGGGRSRRARPRRAWPRARWRARCWAMTCTSARRWCRSASIAIDRARWDWAECENNPFWCPDAQTAEAWETLLDETRKAGNSLGAIVEVEATGVPAGWGAPVYGKLDAELAGALMSINAVKGVEIGAGFAAAALTGVENADEMRAGNDGKPVFLSNKAGGVLGGISTGQPIVARLAIKPTSSILTPRQTIDRFGRDAEISTKGRHDPCVGIRAAPVAEAMLACVLADAKLRHRGQVGR